MKRVIYLLMLSLSIKGAAFAQNNHSGNNTDKTFEFPKNSIHQQVMFELGHGNRLQVDLNEAGTFTHLPDIDSLLSVFIHDMAPFKDSLTDDLSIKRIDYRLDSSGRKEIRVQQYKPKGASYILDKGDLAALKLEQDTVNILSSTYRLSIYINQLSELSSLINGSINAKILILQQKRNIDDWVKGNDGRMHEKKDYGISAKQPFGDIPQPQDVLEISPAASIQNYKYYFVPSFDISATVVINNAVWKTHNSRYKYEIGAHWEPQFFFQTVQGKLQTYRNDFVTLTFGYGLKDTSVQKKSPFRHEISVGYLIRNTGGFYEKNTFRVGLDKVSLFQDKLTIEPVIYFDNLFKGVTPGLRITRGF